MEAREVTHNDARTVFQILLWFLFIIAILSVGARLGTKYAMARKLALADWILIAAQVRLTSPESLLSDFTPNGELTANEQNTIVSVSSTMRFYIVRRIAGSWGLGEPAGRIRRGGFSPGKPACTRKISSLV